MQETKRQTTPACTDMPANPPSSHADVNPLFCRRLSRIKPQRRQRQRLPTPFPTSSEPQTAGDLNIMIANISRLRSLQTDPTSDISIKKAGKEASASCPTISDGILKACQGNRLEQGNRTCSGWLTNPPHPLPSQPHPIHPSFPPMSRSHSLSMMPPWQRS